MSEGPIKQWRDAHKPDRVSTTDAERVCAPNTDTGRAYCGRKNKRTDVWARVTCRDCKAAQRADEGARS